MAARRKACPYNYSQDILKLFDTFMSKLPSSKNLKVAYKFFHPILFHLTILQDMGWVKKEGVAQGNTHCTSQLSGMLQPDSSPNAWSLILLTAMPH